MVVLSEREREVLRRAGVGVRYPKGQIIFSAGEYADRVYLIEDGAVKIYRLDPRGREITVGGIRNPGEIMGLAETLYRATRTCSARAIAPVKLVVLTKAEFLGILAAEHHLALKVASVLGARLRATEGLVYALMCRQVSARLAQLLLKIGERYGVRTARGVKIKLPLTYGEIASMIGSSRQTVTTLMSAFREDGSIAMEGKGIIIRDAEKLAGWVMKEA
ncbi:MAG: Crp/Fnr family transcriptional regulator [Thermoanaerobacterales bacterium]|nr:Crp/Fnr family transcriptional regulator [Thermoanaerobacterales bacterium]